MRKESSASKMMMNQREFSNSAKPTTCRWLLYASLWYLLMVAKLTTSAPRGKVVKSNDVPSIVEVKAYYGPDKGKCIVIV